MTTQRKKFAPQGLTHSAAHHLLAVDEAIRQHGYARVSDIARLLGLTRGSVSVAMGSLRSAGFVEQDENHFYHLTATGSQAVVRIRDRHEIVERFLKEILGLTVEQSHRESCKLENLIEAPTARRLCALLEYWVENDLGGAIQDRLDRGCPVCKSEDGLACTCLEPDGPDRTCTLELPATG